MPEIAVLSAEKNTALFSPLLHENHRPEISLQPRKERRLPRCARLVEFFR